MCRRQSQVPNTKAHQVAARYQQVVQVQCITGYSFAEGNPSLNTMSVECEANGQFSSAGLLDRGCQGTVNFLLDFTSRYFLVFFPRPPAQGNITMSQNDEVEQLY